MAKKILNLDEVLAAQPLASVRWQGVDHEIQGLTVEMFLQARRLAQNIASAADAEAAGLEQSITLLILMAPSLAAHEAELRQLRMPVLQQLLEFALETAGIQPAPAGAAADTPEDAPEAVLGEAMPSA